MFGKNGFGQKNALANSVERPKDIKCLLMFVVLILRMNKCCSFFGAPGVY